MSSEEKCGKVWIISNLHFKCRKKKFHDGPHSTIEAFKWWD